MEEIKINLNGSNSDNISEARIFLTGKDSIFSNKVQFGKSLVNFKDAKNNGYQVLDEDNNYLWVSYQLAGTANLTDKLDADLNYAKIDGKYLTNKKENSDDKLRVGVAVRNHWVDSVHTYIIPVLATSNKGTLLATPGFTVVFRTF